MRLEMPPKKSKPKRKPLNAKTKATMKKHSKHHSKKHMQYMKNSMLRGATFTQAHKRAQKAVGK